jgi:hypothetical protein
VTTKSIDDLIEQNLKGFVTASRNKKFVGDLRNLLVNSIRNCKQCELNKSAHKVMPYKFSNDKCQECKRIIELMPSVKEVLK